MPDETPADTVEHPEHTPTESNLSAAASHVQAGAREVMSEAGLDREGPSIATAALVGVGAAILEPELIPGLLIGAGAVLAPKVVPALGHMLRPLVKGVVKAGYSATMAVREMAAQAGEQVEDIVAEARAEHDAAHGQAAPEHAATQAPKRQRRQAARTPSPAVNL
jgi:Protein of unknown function (DUF5132)